MRQNYFAKLVKYMKNVYHVDRGLNKLSDGRINPTYSTAQVIMPAFFGFLLRIKSFNERWEQWVKNVLCKLYFGYSAL